MKATELRIGNLLRYTDYTKVKEQLRGTPFELTADDILFLSENSVHYVDPIQLTEEWLIKAGLEKTKDHYISTKPEMYKGFRFNLRVLANEYTFCYEGYFKKIEFYVDRKWTT